ELHAADTLAVGCGLSEPFVVDSITRDGPDAVRWLISAGMRLDRGPDGRLAMGREGGHRVPRVVHTQGTASGEELQRTLVLLARGHPKLDLFPHVAGVDLAFDGQGAVAGLLALMSPGPGREERAVLFEARAVIFATGGAGQTYRETTNPPAATGDGLAMALRAGAELQDLEFVQFHPTILYLAGAARFLISEVTRGAGGTLRDRQGRAFMREYHPDGELGPRDVVSRAIFRQMIKTGDTHVYLDLTAVPDVISLFPTLARITAEFGIDIRRDRIPVRPAVHYFVGGIAGDLSGRTTLEGLWAAGECSSTGFHGANRMGSNSLLEGLVHGRRVGREAAGSLGAATRRLVPLHPAPPRHVSGAELSLSDMTYSLKALLWRQVGIEREEAGLQDALGRLQEWEGYLARLGPFNRSGVEVVNMVQVGQVVSFSALFRKESRGTHYRKVHPEADPAWRVHTRLCFRKGGLEIRTLPAGEPAASPPDSGASTLPADTGSARRPRIS
ncbi:MAG: L-aspartate oxidase, partial [Planctomycetota bacterium]